MKRFAVILMLLVPVGAFADALDAAAVSETHIEQCQTDIETANRRAGRLALYPEDRAHRLSDWLGKRGANNIADQEWVYNSFGFKT